MLPLSGVVLLTSLGGSCIDVLPVWRTASSARYAGPCSESDVDVVALGGSHRVNFRYALGSCVV
jgi:hypothetical protein